MHTFFILGKIHPTARVKAHLPCLTLIFGFPKISVTFQGFQGSNCVKILENSYLGRFQARKPTKFTLFLMKNDRFHYGKPKSSPTAGRARADKPKTPGRPS
ncbi:hypothetical protein NIA71_18290 [Ihubacter massiliensis]|uniref:hypothetical protein n=1 Tax=Anaerovoracaceae TaxID=543314 RepID=UPI0011DCF935|nr:MULTISPECIES: hypothetical protein [Eubacteriales Family XIII. Incertae Sedis]MCC2864608.1 hypothetical protein [Anaerovorax odorimutans]MCI7303647.1 hypothetical protein [Clostridia bacterium]MDE8733492.1 hypothetical protein [Eubacteriales bacterium DFI.9.88]MDY3011177.1 hypothetical protein [Clostridiales Family XIII bacterium]MCO7123878.1 hypothetical protein [Ihubacter massiliensis]